MMQAEVGDDVYGDDPSVNQLEAHCAALSGKEAALFAASGTQTNLLALLAHCQRGDEYIVGQQAHTYLYEGGGAAVLGSIQPQPLNFSEPGVMPLEDIRAAIKPDDSHFARTRLISLENTHNGVPLPAAYPQQVKAICEEHGLSLHLDGARLFNAAVKTGQSLAKLCAPFDTVSLCLSKGLGAPVGSVLVGSQPLINQARRWRKVLGGGMRQAGILAAAGQFALTHNIQRLQQDHDNAALLARGLSQISGIEVKPHSAVTNMVFIQVADDKWDKFQSLTQEAGVILPQQPGMRLVVHKDIEIEDIERFLALLSAL